MWQTLRRLFSPAGLPPTPAAVTLGDPDAQFHFACGLLEPYLQLHDRRVRRITAGDRARIDRAIELLEGIARDYPTSWTSRWFLGKARQALGESAAACDAFGEAFALEKANPDVAREFALECLRLGRAEEAVAAASHAVAVRPDDAGLRANVALALLIAGRRDEALATAEEALAHDPRDRITRRLADVIREVIAGRRPQPRRLSDLN